MAEPGKIAVIDVDGSLLCGNSLKMLLFRTLSCQMRKGRWVAMFSLCIEMLKRILHVSSHVRLKEHICNAALAVMTDADFVALTAAMMAKVRPSVRRIINHWIADGGSVVVASAGMRFCLKDMVAQMGLRYLVATEMNPDGTIGSEVRTVAKLKAVISLASSENLGEIGLVLTDHIDDLPLLSLPGIRRVLVYPSRRLRRALETLSLSYEIIN